jgi:hypothetical protein
MTDILYKGYIGKDDFNLQVDSGSPSTNFNRKSSLGTTSQLPVPNIFMTHQNVVNPRYWGDHTCSLDNIKSAIAHIGANRRTLYLEPGTWSITDDYSIPATVGLLVDGGAAITVSSGKTLSIAGQVVAPAAQIFYGDGTVTVSSYPQDQAWWGNAQRLDLTGLSVGGVIVTGAGVTPASTNITMTASSRVIGRRSSGGGLSEELALTDILDFIGSASEGDFLYRGASSWTKRSRGSDGQVSRQSSNVPTWDDAVKAGTTVASTSGTYIDFTSIPSWAKRITVMLAGVSTNGTANLQVQIGDAGGIEAADYIGACAQNGGTLTGWSTGAVISNDTTAAITCSAVVEIVLLDAATNTWAIFGNSARSDAGAGRLFAGHKALSATLDRARITTANGTDAFDAGLVNILYE